MFREFCFGFKNKNFSYPGTLTEGEGSVRLTPLLSKVAYFVKIQAMFALSKVAGLN